MNVKEKIAQELDDLVLAIAEAYNDLISGEIDDEQFSIAVEKVATARDKTENNLIALSKNITREAVAAVTKQPITKEERLMKLVPSKKEASPVQTAPPVLNPPITPPPRTVDEAEDVYAPSPSAPTSLSEAAGVGDPFGGVDEAIEGHNLGLTIEQERRREAGLPIKPLRPKVEMDHTGRREKLLNETSKPLQPVPPPTAPHDAKPIPTAPIPEPEVKKEPRPLTFVEKDALHQIQDIVIPYREDKDKTLAMVSCSILSVVAKAMAREDDAERYSGVQMLWGALTSAVQKLRQLKQDVKFKDDVLALREMVADAIEDILSTVASYPLPDEAPTEKPIVDEQKMEKNDGDIP